MSLIVQIFVLSTLTAVLLGAPTEDKSESTTVGIRPLPAVLSKQAEDKSTESDESKDDTKRVTRDNSPRSSSEESNENKETSSTTHHPYQFGSRPVRDVPHILPGVPTPTSTQSPLAKDQNNPPLTANRQTRDTQNKATEKPVPHPSATKHHEPNRPQFGSRPARDTPHFISGVPTPTSTQSPSQKNQPNPPLLGRKTRDTVNKASENTAPSSHPATQQQQTNKPEPPKPGSRPARDVPGPISGVPTPTSTQSPSQNQNPQTSSRQTRETGETKPAEKVPTPPKPPTSQGQPQNKATQPLSTGRQVRDTKTPPVHTANNGKPQISTLPAKVNKKPETPKH